MTTATVLNQKELCKRWKISITTLYAMRDRGYIKPIPNTTSYALAQIEAIEQGTMRKEIEHKTIRELKEENEQLQARNKMLEERLKSLISFANAIQI